jgi:hypothetical protein
VEGAGLGCGRHRARRRAGRDAVPPGDRVWYAGAINRAGSNSELQLVDERIVGRMPATLGFAGRRGPAADRRSRPGNCCSTAWACEFGAPSKGKSCW